ncbi:MAG: hypothetical protein KDK53_24435 [Maritimibacter sp.]|nr:hypothetical protein [Maritimibacter sp.]
MSDRTSTAPETGSRSIDAVRSARWRPRRLHLHISLWSLAAIVLISLGLVLSSMALTGRVVILPDWVTERVTDELNAALPAGTVSLARVEAGLTRGGRPRLRLVDVGLRDETGLTLAQLNAVEMSLSRRAAFKGRLVPSYVELQGAQVTLRRLQNGAFDLALGQNVGATGNLAALLDQLDAVFETGPIARVAWLAATDLTVTLEDARSGRIWQVTDGTLEITPQDAFIDTTVRFNVFNQTEELASTDFSFRSARDSSEASFAVRFDNAAARDIAAQSPVMAFLSVIDAPISGALRSSVNPDGGLEELAGALQIGAGGLSPVPGAPPAKFDGAKIYIDFDPARQRIDFTGASLDSEIGSLSAEGHVYLTDFQGGWPNSLIGQVDFPHATLAPHDFFAAPLEIDSGTADLRVRLDPFQVEFGQIVAYRGTNRYEARGNLGADGTGWWISLDAGFERASREEVMALWPVAVETKSRDWVAEHIDGGEVTNGTLAFRKQPDGKLQLNGTFGVEGATVRPIEGLAPLEVASGYVSLVPRRVVVVAEAASMMSPDGTPLDLSGSSYLIPTGTRPDKVGTLNLALAGPVRGVLSVLADEPFRVFEAAGGDLGPDMARGEAVAEGRVLIPLRPGKPDARDIGYDIKARLTEVSSDVLIENKLLRGDALELRASNAGIEVTGPVQIGQARAQGTWMMPMVNGVTLPATISGTLELSPAALNEFGLEDVAAMVTGSTRGRFDIELGEPGDAPVLTLSADLGGLGMEIPGTGWRKAPDETGVLRLTARLGARPEVTALDIDAPGLKARGTITTAEGGGLGEAVFERVRLGSWLNAPVTITGRGAGQPVAIAVPGGTIDLRSTEFDGGGGETQAAPGPMRPLTVALNRLIVSDKIQLRDLRADLDLAGGLSGRFSGRLFGGNVIEGTVAQTSEGAAIRLTSNRAGDVLRETGIFAKAKGGTLDLILAPVAGVGTYEGEFTVTNTRIVDAPAMAAMLSAVSIVGLPDQLQGDGIRFDEVEGRFRLSPNAVTLYRSSAVGPSMGLSLDGYYDMEGNQIDMQGVLSPLYIVNALGRVLSPRDGEGLVGFNFTLKGAADKPDVGVNPLSILTPGVLREIFRRAPPTAPETSGPEDP